MSGSLVIPTRFDQAGSQVTGDSTITGSLTISSTLRVPTVYGSASSGGSLTIHSTTHGTKGKILFGSSSAFDEATERLGIGTASPTRKVNIVEASTDPSGTVDALNTSTTATLTTNNGQVIRGVAATTIVDQAGNNLTGSQGARGLDGQSSVTGSSGTVSEAVGVRGSVANAGAGTISSGFGFYASNANSGGGTFTNWTAYYAPATTVGSGLCVAFRGSHAAAAARYNLYMDGTAVNYMAGSLGIGVAGPDASAILQLDSTTKGFAPPRMTEAQRDAITSPIEGLVVYNTTSHKLNVRVAAAWEAITSS